MRQLRLSLPSARPRKAIPWGLIGQVENIAEVVVLLATPGARSITGQTIVVDGGLLAQQRSPQWDIFPHDLYLTVERE
jgi:3-oxoacyl-[acyl-carrier protein] reductase